MDFQLSDEQLLLRDTPRAMLAGYDNVAAFTTMFRRRLGTAPRNYMRAATAR